jgi:TonB family protein
MPWSGPQPEDLRFRRILGAVLALFALVGAIVPYLPLARVTVELSPQLPARLVGIITEPIRFSAAPSAPAEAPAAEGPPVTRLRPTPDVARAPEPEPQSPAATVAPPRKPVAETGLLALRGALERVRRATPQVAPLGPGPNSGAGAVAGPAEGGESLTAGMTDGSGGLGVEGPTHRQILGRTDSPAGGIGNGPGGVGERVVIRSGAGGAPGARANVRSEEEIQEILNRHKRAIYTIYNRELLIDPTLQGKVVVSLTIAASGKVSRCEIVYSELGTASFEDKLVSLLKAIDFGAKRGVPAVTTKVPIEFFPV